MPEETPTSRTIRLIKEDERERCAKLVEGEIYKERYRIWPSLEAGGPVSSNDSELVRFCDAMAATIRHGQGAKR